MSVLLDARPRYICATGMQKGLGCSHPDHHNWRQPMCYQLINVYANGMIDSTCAEVMAAQNFQFLSLV